MSDGPPDYSIVIPCFNEEALLPATLAAAHAAMQAVVSHRGEIVVTDNDSTDASADIARAAGAHVVFEEHRQISRKGKPPLADEIGREDVVWLGHGDVVKTFRRFRDFTGRYVAHCHNVVHEDHAMMFQWKVVP